MPTPEEKMAHEAFSALQQRDRNRARDLLARLIKLNPSRVDYWVWMSTVVDSPKERVFCLKEALRLDPQNVMARRGLIVLGELPVDDSLVVPYSAQKRNWQPSLLKEAEEQKQLAAKAWRSIALYAAGAVLVVMLIAGAAFGAGRLLRPKAQQSGPSGVFIVNATATALPTQTALPGRGITPTPTPPWGNLQLSPTPLYAQTPHPRTEAYRSAVRAYERGDWAGAISYFDQVVAVEPDAPDLYYFIGEAQRQAGNPEEALEAYNTAIEKSASFAPAYLGRARLRLAEAPRAYADSIRADLEKAAALDPLLGEVFLETARLDLLQTGRLEEAGAALDEAALLLPDSPEVDLLRGEVLLAQGLPAEAADALRAGIERNPASLPAYKLLGRALQLDGQYEESLEPLQIYIQYANPDAEALAWLGAAYAGQGEYTLALETLDRAVALDDESFEALYQRGLVHLELEEYEQARRDLSNAYVINMDSFAANLALARADLKVNATREAFALFEASENLSRSDADLAQVYYYRGIAQHEYGSMTAALRDFRALLEMPADLVPADWLEEIRGRMDLIISPTPSPSPQASATRRASATPTPRASATPTLKPGGTTAP
ncbi:MAG: tetratricopeptide repeat protein [Chloroflexi bacterium]|nr:tetratricopeptide repeat protein [Chloroflexota bacterium]